MAIWTGEIKELERLYESLKGQLPDLEKELERLIKADDENMILLYSRRCLEVIIIDLCECELKRPRKTEPLKGIIDKLHKEEKVPSHIISSMNGLNELSTYGTHPKHFDPEQIKPVLVNLDIIIKWYLKYKNITTQLQTDRSEKIAEITLPEQECFSTEPGNILYHKGPVNFNTIEILLTNLKKAFEFQNLNKTVSKRVYAIIVECLENISKHSLKNPENISFPDPYLSVRKQRDEIIIKTGNPVSEDSKKRITKRLNQINNLNESDLKSLYDEIINRELKPDKNGAGLGFIMMALKSGNRIDYNFPGTDFPCTFTEIKIKVSSTSLKNLVIKQTASTPKVIFDTDKNIFEISGESRPHDVPGFYEVLLKWLDEFSLHLSISDAKQEPVTFNFNFEYFNSLSAKYILDFCTKLTHIRNEGKNIFVKWHYEEDDMDMLDAGREMSRISKFPFEYVQKGPN
jgi:hypothetical protein